jgi:predicted metal-dependent hydrolase
MITKVANSQITVNGLQVEIVRKDIKNLHLGVYPPNGRVRVAAPLKVSDEAIRLAVVGKLGWIGRKRRAFADQARQSKRELVTGESHYYLGQRYRLRVIPTTGASRVEITNKATIDLHVRRELTSEQRDAVLQDWYRRNLKAIMPAILDTWQPVLGVQPSAWRIQRMKTKWGSCNDRTRRILVNLELAKKPVQCLEYIVVHELVHLIERKHNERFIQIMDSVMPLWRLHKEALNAAPLAHESWGY